MQRQQTQYAYDGNGNQVSVIQDANNLALCTLYGYTVRGDGASERKPRSTQVRAGLRHALCDALHNAGAYAQAVSTTNAVLNGQTSDITNGATFFYSSRGPDLPPPPGFFTNA
ncbi:MAG TPA: hypothetical protein VHL08_06225 [Dongiaceae bacterium]|nr:hypothetical protein [Dongiaceae bacterium]